METCPKRYRRALITHPDDLSADIVEFLRRRISQPLGIVLDLLDELSIRCQACKDLLCSKDSRCQDCRRFYHETCDGFDGLCAQCKCSVCGISDRDAKGLYRLDISKLMCDPCKRAANQTTHCADCNLKTIWLEDNLCRHCAARRFGKCSECSASLLNREWYNCSKCNRLKCIQCMSIYTGDSCSNCEERLNEVRTCVRDRCYY